jgi:hexosaminidase
MRRRWRFRCRRIKDDAERPVTAPVGRRSVVYGATFLQPISNAISGRSAPGLSFALFDGNSPCRTSRRQSGVDRKFRSLDLEQFGRTLNYGVRFEGYLNVEADNFYRFAIESDDGSVLTIDDEVVVDNDGDHGPRLVTGHVPLRRGLHKISLRYFQSEGGETLSVGWAAADGELQSLAGPALVH